MKILGMFPGQGSQKAGMGREWFDGSERARDLFGRADEALGFALSDICFNGPQDKLTHTEIAQPAILTVSVVAFEIAKEKLGGKLELVAAAGHSLGEYSALVAAGAIRFEDAVRLVNKRGRFMQSAVPSGRGKMVAVLGQELDAVEEALREVTAGIAQIANINAPGQVVVAGSREGVDEFVTKLPGAKVTELQVSAPFHCELMLPAAAQLDEELKRTKFDACRFPVYANFSATPVREPQDIQRSLTEQVCGRVRWVECMERAIADHEPELAVEFGAGNVLVNLLKRIAPDQPRYAVATPDALEKFPFPS